MVGQKETLKILQQNTRKSYDVMVQLFEDKETKEYDIIAIQEPWRRSECNTTYHSDKSHFELLYLNNETTRVCYYVNKRLALSSWSITNHSSDLATLHLKATDERIIHIHNIYNPGQAAPNKNASVERLQEILRGASGTDEHIWLGDFNLHHPAWGGIDVEYTEADSEILLEAIEEHQMEQLLTPGTITYSQNQANTTIDLVFATPLLRQSLITCRTKSDTYGSDHYPIETRFTLHTIVQENQEKRHFKKTDPEKLRSQMEEELKHLRVHWPETTEDLEQQVEGLITAIHRSIEVSTPMLRICKRSVPGFDEECKEAQMRARRLRKHFMKTHDEVDWEVYVLARNETKSLIRRKKRKEYRESREEACQDPKNMWKAVKSARRTGPPSQACIPAIKRSDSTLEDDPVKKMKLLEKVFFPPPPQAELDDIVNYNYPADIPTGAITAQEVKAAIEGPQSFKAPGPSGIPNRILQLLIDLLVPPLCIIFNASLTYGHYPSAFRDSVTIVLKKAESDDPSEPRDYSEPKSYRPIALLETLGKAMETILAKRIAYVAETNNLLPKNHMGGRRCTSTEHAIHLLIERIIAAWNKGQILSALFLDVMGAFDNVAHRRLLHNLRKRRIDQRIVNWTSSFLTGRTTVIKTSEGVTERININIGIPQGSPLSPILYLFYNADLIETTTRRAERKKDPTMDKSGYIDDVMLAATGPNAEATNETLAKAHEECQDWARKHGSKFAPKKYQLVHFSRRRKAEHLDLKLGEDTIKASTSARFLGVRMDSKLDWKEHMNLVKKKATKSIAGISRLAGSTWGGNLLTIRRLYEAIVIPQLTYCCSAWYRPEGEFGHRKKTLEDIRIIEARGLRVVTGAFKATPRPALNIEATMLPIKQRLEKLTSETMLRIAATPTHEVITEKRSKKKTRTKTPLEVLTDRFERRTKQKIDKMEKMVPYVVAPWWRSPKISISRNKDSAKKSHQALLETKRPGQMLIYTDGSGINNKVGAAAVAPEEGVTMKSFLGTFKCFTVYTAELRGIDMALIIAIRRHQGLIHTSSNYRLQKVTILTDNQAAILSTAHPSGQSGQSILIRITESINILRTWNIETEIQWIPAHIGVDGNELADVAAKQATGWRLKEKSRRRFEEVDTKWTAPYDSRIPIMKSAMKTHYNQLLNDEWTKDWREEKRGRGLFKITPKPTKRILKLHRGLKKWASSLLVQMRTQKIGLNSFLFGRRVSGFETPDCPCGRGLQDVRHVLWNCTRWRRKRRALWKDEMTKPGWWFALTDLGVLLNNPTLARKAVIFMADTGLLGQYNGLAASQKI